MEGIFKTILVTSLYASIVGISILIIKTVLRNRINPKWHYIIWLVLVLKLVVPFGPGSIISLFNTVPQVPQDINFSHDYETYHKSVEAFRLDNPEIPFGMQVKDTTLSVAAMAEKVLPYIWIIGAATMLGWLLYTHFSLYRKVRKNPTEIPGRLYPILEKCKQQFDISMDIQIVIQEIIKTPAIFGIAKPRILVSPDILNLSDKDMSYIFLHELAHCQRKDTAANYILLALQTIHWFNPIIWFCFRKIRQDMEVAADEKVLGLLEGKEQKEYGKALLSLLERFSAVKLAPRLIGMVDDKRNIERRIRMIKMTEFFKSKRRTVVLTGVLCIILLGGVMLTGAAEKGEINNKPNKTDITNMFKNPLETASVDAPETLVKLKNPYVGNHVKDLELLKLIGFYNKLKGISLQTEKKPYGMTVNYDLSNAGFHDETIASILSEEAALIFALIDNVDELTFDCNTGAGKQYKFVREILQRSFVKDLRQYAKDGEALAVLLNSFPLKFFISPDKYNQTMSNVPGIQIETNEQYKSADYKIKYSTNYGKFLLLNKNTGEIKESYNEQDVSTPVYWSPESGGNVAENEVIWVKAQVKKGTRLVAERKLNINRDSANFNFTVQPSADIYLENTNTVSPEESALKVVTQYFNAFAKADYKTMSTLATEHHNSLYIHSGDVFGMVWAKAKSIKYESFRGKMRFVIDVEMEAAKISVFYPEQKETSFVVQLIKDQDGKWRIDELTTG